MLRYVCIDLGDERTGIAAGDDLTRIASPVRVLEVPMRQAGGDALLRAIVVCVAELLSERDQGELVVGLPINMDGTMGPRAKLVQEFAQRIHAATNRTTHLHDERLSTRKADGRMAQTGLTHKQKKARRDAIAAAEILASFLASLPHQSPTMEPRPPESI